MNNTQKATLAYVLAGILMAGWVIGVCNDADPVIHIMLIPAAALFIWGIMKE